MNKKSYALYTGKRIGKLLIRYWIIVLMFSSISILLGNSKILPGSFMELLGNLTLVRMTYNGAWWFLTIYIYLSCLSKILYRLTERMNAVLLFLGVGIIYFIAYLIRFDIISVPHMNEFVNWAITQIALLGTSLLPYIWGMMFYKYKIISIIRNTIQFKSKITQWCVSILMFGLCIIIHGFIESLIIAPFFAIVTVCIISLWNEKNIVFLKYMGEHSTNIWLVHMFFYLSVFKDLVFKFQYPILIFIAMLCCSIASSYIINWCYGLIIKSFSRICKKRCSV